MPLMLKALCHQAWLDAAIVCTQRRVTVRLAVMRDLLCLPFVIFY
ncbi:hypothetical protein [Micromonospora maritima]